MRLNPLHRRRLGVLVGIALLVPALSGTAGNNDSAQLFDTAGNDNFVGQGSSAMLNTPLPPQRSTSSETHGGELILGFGQASE